MDYVIILLLIIAIVLEVLILFKKKDNNKEYMSESESRILKGIDNLSQNENRMFSDTMERVMSIKSDISDRMNEKFIEMIRNDTDGYKQVSSDLQNSISRMNEAMETKILGMREEMGKNLGNINDTLLKTVKENADSQLKLQNMTEEKLNTIQKNVNDKLDVSLNKRLDESFDRVTKQLSELYKSLGELGEMSDGITNLNRTLSNVKTRGTWGEIQLGNILEDTMTEGQYVKNIKLKKNSDDIVEYAVKIPAKDDDSESIYLPIDSKFPLDIYGKLLEAGETGDKVAYDKAVKELEHRIKDEAKTIKDKYITPPTTTDFAIMFLPTESMYAEVLRINGLAEACQTQYRVIIASPSTITALLNSLRVGFANVALNKKTEEVRKMLQAVKTQYGKLDELIDGTKKRLLQAVESTDKLKKRTDLIQRSMNKISQIEENEADSILQIEDETFTRG